MNTQTRFIFRVVNVLIWVVFIGLCIRTGTYIFNLILNLFFEVGDLNDLFESRNLNGRVLLEFGRGHHYAMFALIIIFSAMQAYLAWLAVKIFTWLRPERPFSGDVTWLIRQMSYVALGAGVMALAAEGYTAWIIKQGIDITNNWNGGSFLLLAGIIYIIAEVFRKGTELQNENELTV